MQQGNRGNAVEAPAQIRAETTRKKTKNGKKTRMGLKVAIADAEKLLKLRNIVME